MKIQLNSRKHYYRAMASALVICLTITTLVLGMVGCGADISNDLEIRTWDDLDLIRYNLDGHHILMNDLDATTEGYEDLASPTAYGRRGWRPIGTWEDSFAGTFDGQGYEIRDLFIERPEADYEVGLFGNSKGDIENVGVVNATVVGHYDVGGLLGQNLDGTVSNCRFSGNVTGFYGGIGGLVGGNGGVLRDSYCIGNVTVTGDEDLGGLGGLLGISYAGTVMNSHYNYNKVLINGENIITVGALLDEDFDEWLANDMFLDVNERLSQEDGYYIVSNITDFKQLLAFGMDASLRFRLTDDLDLAGEPNFYIPYFAGEFDGNGHRISNLSFDFGFISGIGLFGYLAYGGIVNDVGVENVNIHAYGLLGGLIGWNGGDVSGSYSTGSVYGWGDAIGGLVGWNEGDVSNCYFSGDVTGFSSVGGLLGGNSGNVERSYSSGGVGAIFAAGGLAGSNSGGVNNSYSSANVIGEESVGGLVGSNSGGVDNSYSTGSVTSSDPEIEDIGGLVGYNWGTSAINSFWDIETSGQTISAGGTGKTTAEMQDITTFSGATWDIIAVNGTDQRNPEYIWNIVGNVTYPFQSWQP